MGEKMTEERKDAYGLTACLIVLCFIVGRLCYVEGKSAGEFAGIKMVAEALCREGRIAASEEVCADYQAFVARIAAAGPREHRD